MKLCIWPVYELREGSLQEPLSCISGLLMTVFLAHRLVTIDLLWEVFWPNPDLAPELWYGVICSRLYRLRQKLAKFGWRIVNRQSFGWHLEGPREGLPA